MVYQSGGIFGAVQQQTQTAGAPGAPDAINILGAYLPTIYISKIALDSTIVDRPLVVKDPHIQTVKFSEEEDAMAMRTGHKNYKQALLENGNQLTIKSQLLRYTMLTITGI